MIRLTENDRHIGRRITYGRTDWKALRLVYGSGAHDDGPGPNELIASGFGWVARITLPRLLDDHKIRRVAESWDAATVERMGRNWYELRYPREFGFSLSDGFLQVFLGAQTMDSSTTQSWAKHLPWTQWRFYRFSLFDTAGQHFYTEFDKNRRRVMWLDPSAMPFQDQMAAEKSVPKAVFVVEDYDGERITVTTHLEEREWRFGEGWFKWLSLFRRPKVRRSLSINFAKECGPEKGSWKGGLMGTGIDVLPGELHEAAFRRYCDQQHTSKYRTYRITFVATA